VHLNLSPLGRLTVVPGTDGDPDLALGFAAGTASGLLALAACRDTGAWDACPMFWRGFVDAYLTSLAHSPSSMEATAIPPIESLPATMAEFTLRAPSMSGGEYVSPDLLAGIWRELDALARAEASKAGGLKSWLGQINPAMHLLGRVTFHLAENKRSEATPFAFMATFTHRLSASAQPVHLPLGRALQEFAGAGSVAALQSLLEPVRKASESSTWAREQLESRRLFQPQAWTPAQAHAFLKEIPVFETSGILVRIPDWWKTRRNSRPKVTVRIGDIRGAGLGLDAMLDFEVETTLDGETLTAEEWKALVRGAGGLVPLRGRWVEVDPEKLQGVLDHWKVAREQAGKDGVTFLQAMRLISGVRLTEGVGAESAEAETDWSEVVAGEWLATTLESLRQPGPAHAKAPRHAGLQAQLRPYQEAGVDWLWLLQGLGLGACLADDMGLGKTIQVIAVLLRMQREAPLPDRAQRGRGLPDAPSLLVAPASLLANWKGEIARFAPSLRIAFAHPSESGSTDWRSAETANRFMDGKDLIITTYGQAARLDWMPKHQWRLVVLDEAQAIKNATSRQTRAVKLLPARARIALTGTPVENRLGDLWSLFDFLNPGLLGKSTDFSRYVKRLQDADQPDFAPLRQLVRPYLLRRLKTDRRILPDLPDKTEVIAWCPLSRRQAGLYQRSIEELAERLDEPKTDGIQRRGIVLAFLMRLKQICNHPGHWLGDGSFAPEESGKFQRLTELAEEIGSRQERLLVFTQFREMTVPLADHLRTVFGRPGLILDGSTAVARRQQLVTQFQHEDGPPFFVLSLKAGGTGLNLTAASHVIHFDRWWNPAVENQATDRAFRIGQKRNVLVHKFACRGTVEERIEELLASKRELADSALGTDGGPDKLLTEMSNAEILDFVSLDLHSTAVE
jgi:non-specific serine/threonine protein kinase